PSTLSASAKPGARRVSALALDSFVHGFTGYGLRGAGLGTSGEFAISSGPAGGGRTGVVDSAGGLCLRATARGGRAQAAASGFAGTCGRRSVGRATRSTERDDCSFAAQLQGVD